MTLLRELRRVGAKVRLNDQGKLAIKGTPDDLRPRIKVETAALIAALKAEESFGALYANSELYWRLDDLFISARRIRANGVAVEACDRLTAIVEKIDTAGRESMATATAAIASFRDEVTALLASIEEAIHPALEGTALEQLAATVFEVAPADPSPPSAPAPRIDVGAFIADPDVQEALL